MTSAALSLIFARHGRTAWNQAGLYQGRSDPPLAPDGRVDAEVLGGALRGAAISQIIASPLQRAAMSARVVADRLGVTPVLTDPRLMEIAYGGWEGLTQAEVKQRWPDQLRQWKQAPGTMRFPGGETLAEARARLLAFLGDLLPLARTTHRERVEGPVLVVAHGGLIRLAILEARRAPLADFRRIDVEPGSLHRFVLGHDVGGARLSLKLMEILTCA